ncbi:hypothetical protein BDR07DRAFT_1489169 [Suillus spraguei]|nr:hypothetical protein BDR07DRAFT_1489169 [Suillus spraguei]
MEQQLAVHAAQASRTSNAISTQSLAVDNPQELHPQPLPPATPAPPAIPAPPALKQLLPLPSLSPVPVCLSTPDQPINLQKHKQPLTPVAAIHDNSPLTEDEEPETNQPYKHS